MPLPSFTVASALPFLTPTHRKGVGEIPSVAQSLPRFGRGLDSAFEGSRSMRLPSQPMFRRRPFEFTGLAFLELLGAVLMVAAVSAEEGAIAAWGCFGHTTGIDTSAG